MKVVIVMTYFDRQYQLDRTLKSLAESKHRDFEVVIVDDGSKEPILRGMSSFPITVLRVEPEDKKWTNPEPAYNIGLKHALSLNPDIVMIQNAENYHVGDVISYATNVTDQTYIAFGCFSLDKESTFSDHNINELIQAHQHKVIISGAIGWYNHPRFRPNAFDFCTAITAKNIKTLNGFDERFSDGYAMGDCNLIDRIRKMGLQVEITEYPFVVHQWHYHFDYPGYYERLHAKNKLIYLNLKRERNFKAKHVYTKDL
jgi:glycosyltransferase involved in cell wall biosynthesis